jgi:hypothetical protein
MTTIARPVTTARPPTAAPTTEAAPPPSLKAPPFVLAPPTDGFQGGTGKHNIIDCMPPPPPPNLGDIVYASKLRNMSDAELKNEQFTQQLNQLVAQFTGDTRGAADAQRKLGMIEKEQARRAGGGELQAYKAQLRHMSTPQLHAEQRKQFGQYIMSMLRGDSAGAQQAMKKLEAVGQEIDRRQQFFPIDPIWKGIDTRL